MKANFIKSSFIFLIILLTNTAFGQKSSVKNETVFADDIAIALIKVDGCKALSPSCTFYISSINGKPLITIAALTYDDPKEVDIANNSGTVRYLRLAFTDFDNFAEIKNPAMFKLKSSDIARIIVKANLIKGDSLDLDAVKNYINANGSKFSNRQKEISSPSIIIINNN